MVEQSTGADRRARRSTRVSRQLAAARDRNNKQLVAIREREVLVDQALRDYVAASEEVVVADQVCQDKVAQLEQRIKEARTLRDDQVARTQATQAHAVAAIHDAGRTVKQVAELLALSEKATRQLLKDGRGSGPAVSAKAGAPDYRERTAARESSDRDPVRETRQYTTTMTTPPPRASSASAEPTVRS
jgi:hypothetical protein